MKYPADTPATPTAAEVLAQQESDRVRLRLSAQATIKRLCPKYTTQEKLEQVLGLRVASLARLRNLAETPTAPLVILLELIVINPKVRLKEVETLNRKRGTSPQLQTLSGEQTDHA
jgi:hypothetical protein